MTAEFGSLARALAAELEARPRQFHELADAHRDAAWPEFLRAWGELRRAGILRRDEDGNYLIGREGVRESHSSMEAARIIER